MNAEVRDDTGISPAETGLDKPTADFRSFKHRTARGEVYHIASGIAHLHPFNLDRLIGPQQLAFWDVEGWPVSGEEYYSCSIWSRRSPELLGRIRFLAALNDAPRAIPSKQYTLAIDKDYRSPIHQSPAKRQTELEWLSKNKEMLGQYQGQWIGVEGTQLIAHSVSAEEVFKAVKEKGIAVPFIVFVPRKQEGIFMGL